MASAMAEKSRRDIAELVTGAIVLCALAAMLVATVLDAGRKSTGDGYQLGADFSHIDGLDIGSDVRLAGVTVGHVVSESVNPQTFRAHVVFTVRPDLHLSDDTAAIITSDSLLGGKYIALSPGGDDRTLSPGATMTQTQGSISLEQLLSKFIFSVTDTLTRSRKTAADHAQSGQEGAP
ncbi:MULTISPECIES: outer membrane lipid asymmetry maintenance protein MlaD [Acetobacter]|jgi:phospholipid/cholesterol/gamma-HCH transport system substrate-binding protein|uniref:Outer membrane lipid asymmetry maintenance protein MlaD n=1 Tax=Acetobacter peroxydans TaxID=104098 RepID=A0A4Y3TXP0_9PROT|nr:outer membrane lipid asymmetry maintenance protein MlaD [Acetobacter peroxydans]MCH4142219.1 outer membrane lipid asymmetry maintenance protein MlaD [Acetobacter peroxydans]MCI1395830.1 outer membrane lipid asymmetry maintenance protein MlaD [Acetobacter peroxydans]MCI1410871.1 outer membrane lipid asymmetry maintenance protein MlaD [Acetobacter peroxydans]MCI1566130.1 outer membrane lipid asymmetry maintenance protein MlaD [Acetobacter peroxydans]MCI1618468.1 outer membrane lipid asymmetry